MLWLIALGVTCTSSAAALKLRWRPAASKARSVLKGGRRSFTTGTISVRQHNPYAARQRVRLAKAARLLRTDKAGRALFEEGVDTLAQVAGRDELREVSGLHRPSLVDVNVESSDVRRVWKEWVGTFIFRWAQ